MKLCDCKHPEHYVFFNGKRIGFGGHTGDLPIRQVQRFFNNVTIHRNGQRTTAEVNGKFIPLFKDDNGICCAVHRLDAELIKVAMLKEAIQTHPWPGGAKTNGRWNNPLTRAFVQARKLACK